eukprot:4882534-Amphidinium_carterae.1
MSLDSGSVGAPCEVLFVTEGPGLVNKVKDSCHADTLSCYLGMSCCSRTLSCSNQMLIGSSFSSSDTSRTGEQSR